MPRSKEYDSKSSYSKRGAGNVRAIETEAGKVLAAELTPISKKPKRKGAENNDCGDKLLKFKSLTAKILNLKLKERFSSFSLGAVPIPFF